MTSFRPGQNAPLLNFLSKVAFKPYLEMRKHRANLVLPEMTDFDHFLALFEVDFPLFSSLFRTLLADPRRTAASGRHI